MQRQEIPVAELGESIGHYADAVRLGDLLFISGWAPVDVFLRLIGGEDVVAQIEQVLANLGRVLAVAARARAMCSR